MASFISELRRRNVLRFLAAYAVSGWILIEAGSVLLPTFGAADWVFKTYALLVIAGVPIAAVFAWIFELTPEGLKRTLEVTPETSVTRSTGRKLDFAIIGLLIIALGISITLNITGMREADSAGPRVGDRQSIAVLPFTSRSTDPENAVFTDGIHDDLLTSLANIGALKVISRTSVMEYRDTRKNLREIAGELGVGTVLEGAVQRAGDKVRINVQLIDAVSDQHLWAERYDRELSVKNIFAIQSEISQAIAAALKARLTPEEQGRLETVPTENLAAYNLYLAGRSGLHTRRLSSLHEARQQFEQAIELDPEFAQAYSGLADSLLLLQINHNAIDQDEAYHGAQRAIDRALALDPNLADAYASLGLLKMHIWELTRTGPGLDEAEAAFRRAIELNPNHASAYMWYAGVFGDRDEPERGIEYLNRALELDPLARIPQTNLAVQYAQLGRNQEALDQWLRAVRLHPDWPNPHVNISGHLASLGRLDEAMAWIVQAQALSTDPLAGGNAVGLYLEFGEDDRVLAFFESIPADHPLSPVARAFTDVIQRDYDSAVAKLEAILAGAENPVPFVLNLAASAATLAGDFPLARGFLEKRRPQLAGEAGGEVDRFNLGDAVHLAYLLQRLGEAERAGSLLEQALPVIDALPRLGLAGHGIQDVHVLALQGRSEEALARLREAVDAGFRSCWAFYNWTLKEDPYLESLYPRPEFRAIVAELDTEIARMRERVAQAEANGDWEPLLAMASSQPVIARLR